MQAGGVMSGRRHRLVGSGVEIPPTPPSPRQGARRDAAPREDVGPCVRWCEGDGVDCVGGVGRVRRRMRLPEGRGLRCRLQGAALRVRAAPHHRLVREGILEALRGHPPAGGTWAPREPERGEVGEVLARPRAAAVPNHTSAPS
jgi:hypothetical protein